MAFIIFFFLKRFEKVEKTVFFSAKFFFHCTLSLILGLVHYFQKIWVKCKFSLPFSDFFSHKLDQTPMSMMYYIIFHPTKSQSPRKRGSEMDLFSPEFGVFRQGPLYKWAEQSQNFIFWNYKVGGLQFHPGAGWGCAFWPYSFTTCSFIILKVHIKTFLMRGQKSFVFTRTWFLSCSNMDVFWWILDFGSFE